LHHCLMPISSENHLGEHWLGELHSICRKPAQRIYNRRFCEQFEVMAATFGCWCCITTTYLFGPFILSSRNCSTHFSCKSSGMKPASVSSPHGCYVEAEFSTFDRGLSKLTVSTSQKLAGRLPKRDGGACGFADDARASCTSVDISVMMK
jgi:hypothetical protein